MSDLSNLLGDVYGAPSPAHDEPPARREPAAGDQPSEFQWAPAWSSESRLDQAFDGWVPGEPPSGGEQRAEALAVEVRRPQPRRQTQPPAMPAFQAHAPVPAAPAPAPRPAPLSAPAAAPLKEMAVVAPTPARPWVMGDDDIFPGGKKVKSKKK